MPLKSRTSTKRMGNTSKKTKALPEGPYASQYSSGDWWLASDWQNGQEVWVVVRDDQQRNQGNKFPTKREALSWLKDNGYKRKTLRKSLTVPKLGCSILTKHECHCQKCSDH